MDLLIRIKNKKDYKLIHDLTKRLGLKSKTLSADEREDAALLLAMEEGKKSGLANEDAVMSKLQKIAAKK